VNVDTLLAKVDELHDLAKEAGSNYDYLRFGSDELGASDFATVLGACLTGLEDDLAELSKDLLSLALKKNGIAP
jgi:hypothetical protein